MAMTLFQILLAAFKHLGIEELNTALTLAERNREIKTYEDVEKKPVQVRSLWQYRAEYIGAIPSHSRR